MFDQCREVRDILSEAASPARALTLAVTASVIGQYAKRLSQTGNDKIPVMMRVQDPCTRTRGINLLGDGKRIVDLDAEVTHCALDLGVS